MSLLSIINVGAAVLGGGMQGFCDGMEIDLQALDFIPPIVGIFTLPITSKLVYGHPAFFKNTLLAGTITGASYVLCRGAAVMVKNYT